MAVLMNPPVPQPALSISLTDRTGGKKEEKEKKKTVHSNTGG